MQAPINASQVFTFLRRNYRISRNTRALWQFQQIAASPSNQVRIPTADEIVRLINISLKRSKCFLSRHNHPMKLSFYQPWINMVNLYHHLQIFFVLVQHVFLILQHVINLLSFST